MHTAAVPKQLRLPKRDAEKRVWEVSFLASVSVPAIPFWLEADLAVPLDLELTYTNTCESLRIA
jgi:hypothetical protein